MRALFDVSLLLALFDPDHVHHHRAGAWWSAHRDQGWASCPLTENGFVRIISKPGYPRPLNLQDAVAVLQAQIGIGGHEFWPDLVSIADPDVFDHHGMLGPSQITDAYLLALAVKKGGRFATFDSAVSLAAVRRAERQHLVVL